MKTEEYKKLIDKLARLEASAAYKLAEFRKNGSWKTLEDNDDKEAVASLSLPQRKAVEAMLAEMIEIVTHDLLVLLKDGDYRIKKDGVEIAHEPFGNPINYDYMMRRLGEPWPDE